MPRYDPRRIEPRWQAYWDEFRTFVTGDFEPGRDYQILVDEGEGDKRYRALLVPSGSGVVDIYDETLF